MIRPVFTFDAEANGYVSEPFTIQQQATVHIELASLAPVLTLKQENDGEYAVYGQTPDESDRYKINLTTSDEAIVKIATPVDVLKCYVLN